MEEPVPKKMLYGRIRIFKAVITASREQEFAFRVAIYEALEELTRRANIEWDDWLVNERGED